MNERSKEIETGFFIENADLDNDFKNYSTEVI